MENLKETSCTICVMGEDRSAGCFQELQVMNCNVPFDIAKKMFELHNRYNDEYEDTSHLLYGAGHFAREKMDEQMQDGQSYAKGSKFWIY